MPTPLNRAASDRAASDRAGMQMVAAPGMQMVAAPGMQMVAAPDRAGMQMVAASGMQMVAAPDRAGMQMVAALLIMSGNAAAVINLGQELGHNVCAFGCPVGGPDSDAVLWCFYKAQLAEAIEVEPEVEPATNNKRKHCEQLELKPKRRALPGAIELSSSDDSDSLGL